MANEPQKKQSEGRSWNSLAIGIGLGLALGAALGNVAIGLALGVALGVGPQKDDEG